MTTAKSNDAKGLVVTNGMASNGEKLVNGSGKSAHNTSSVHQSKTREQSVKVTRRYREELTILSNGSLYKPESVESFLDFVVADRLRRIPHRGDKWDKILRWAEYFATQVSILEESVASFVHNSEETAQLVWASCRILLEVGHSLLHNVQILNDIRWARNIQ